jgi:hypothetical protein
MFGEHGGIVADARQEGGIHFRQPLQAEEIQPGDLGDAVAEKRLAANFKAETPLELWTYSAAWALYGGSVLAFGALRDASVLRWSGLALRWQ